jgi:hypothetical protein
MSAGRRVAPGTARSTPSSCLVISIVLAYCQWAYINLPASYELGASSEFGRLTKHCPLRWLYPIQLVTGHLVPLLLSLVLLSELVDLLSELTGLLSLQSFLYPLMSISVS